MNFKSLTLNSYKLQEQRTFYTEVLGFPLVSSSEQDFIIQAGKSQLRFIKSAEAAYYHFAFNIPYPQMTEALTWLKTRVPVLDDGGEELIDFINWKAKAIYFFDRDNNILEFIGRSTLPSDISSPFTAAAISEISEIGMPVQNVQASLGKMKWVFELEVYGACTENFCAAGDEKGLFIIVNRADKKWYPTAIAARPFPWSLVADKGGKTIAVNFDGEEVNVI